MLIKNLQQFLRYYVDETTKTTLIFLSFTDYVIGTNRLHRIFYYKTQISSLRL